jgi:uncharacterized protein YgiM (DUF1202 family)
MGFSGRLEGIAPSDIFQIISQNKMTGTLIARCVEGTAMVVFKAGQVIEAASDAPRESLGNLLLSQGILSEATLAEAQVLQKQKPDAPLGMLLVEMKAISAKALEGVVLKQIEQIVHRLVSCEDGFITFDRGEMALKRKLNTREFLLPDGVSTEYLIMEGARTLDEEHKNRLAQPASAWAGRPLVGAEPREEFPAGREAEMPRHETATLKSLFHEIRLLKDGGRVTVTLVRNVKQTVAAADSMLDRFVVPLLVPFLGTVRRMARALPPAGRGMALKVKQLPSTAGSALRRSLMPLLGSAGGKVRKFSQDGRAMTFTGIAATAAGIVLILATTLSFQTKITGSVLVVSKPVALIRAEPSITGKVIAKTGKGETFPSLESAEGWYKVQAKAGTGWISEQVVDRKDKTGMAVVYHMKGYELVFLAGLALFVVGMVRRKNEHAQEAE